MMEAVKAGVGRETAHKVIKEHAVATVDALRAREVTQNDLLGRLATDERIPLTIEQLEALLEEGRSNAGSARSQVAAFNRTVNAWTSKFPNAASYEPGSIL
jgi:adenylosuccinate lyase